MEVPNRQLMHALIAADEAAPSGGDRTYLGRVSRPSSWALPTSVGMAVHDVRMLTFLVALAVFVATGLQMLVALVDTRDAHRAALQVQRVEEQLIREQPRLRRRRWRKEIRSWRDDQTERSLAYVDVVAFSWTLLVAASAAASTQAAGELF